MTRRECLKKIKPDDLVIEADEEEEGKLIGRKKKKGKSGKQLAKIRTEQEEEGAIERL
jgi:hypothetical protein